MMKTSIAPTTLILCAWITNGNAIDAAPYNRYIRSPTTRNIQPTTVLRTNSNTTAEPQYGVNAFRLTGANASVTFDFGIEVAGLPTLDFHESRCGALGCNTFGLPSLSCLGSCDGLGLAYSESSQYVGQASDQSTIYSSQDGTVYLPLLSNGTYQVPAKWGRGGFRYLTLSLGSNTALTTSTVVSLKNLYYTPAPHLRDNELQAYTGYFCSSDELLNSIWYAGAYTLQMCSVSANSSVQHTYVVQGSGWSQDSQATGLSPTDVFLVDGAKRDRNAWAGDVSISFRSALVTHNYDNVRAIRNVLEACIVLQDTNILSATHGYFPYAGSPLGDLLKLFPVIAPFGSDTYHLYTIKSFAEYVLATNGTAFLSQHWDQVNTGVQATYPFIQNDGLLNSTRTLDWGRVGQGEKNIAVNALYYGTLNSLVVLTTTYPSFTSNADTNRWLAMATQLKKAANVQLWDTDAGLYKDNTTAAGALVHPQDGNAFAIEYGLTDSSSKNSIIAQNLARRLTPYGAPSTELAGSISPFISSHELIAQFAVAETTGDASHAINLARTQWGYMQRAFSNATFIEGYASNGTLNYGFYTGAPSFISHAHAWSTGPTYSLTHDVVGIRATRIDVPFEDGDWAIKPVIMGSGLTHAQGGVQAPQGKFDVRWNLDDKPQRRFELNVSVPVGTKGTIYVPTFQCDPKIAQIRVDGRLVQLPSKEGPFFRLSDVAGGETSVTLLY